MLESIRVGCGSTLDYLQGWMEAYHVFIKQYTTFNNHTVKANEPHIVRTQKKPHRVALQVCRMMI